MMVVWPLAGVLVGAANMLTLFLTVSRLRPGAPSRAVSMAIGGMVTRLLLVAGLLVVGLRDSIISGLLAFGGLWLARWSAVFWAQTHQLAWSRPSAAATAAPPSQSRGSRGNARHVEREDRPRS